MNAHQKIKILLVEDNPVDVLLLQESFADFDDLDYELTHVELLSGALAHIAVSRPDIVLLDLGLPDSQGVETFLSLHRHAPDVPTLVLTALNDANIGLRAVRAGAQDYLIKKQAQAPLLCHAIRYAIERHSFAAALVASELRTRSIIDANADAMLIVDEDGMVCFVNPSAEQMFGRKSEALLGSAFGFLLVDGQTTEVDIVGNNQKTCTAQMRVVTTQWNDKQVFLATLRDVTAQKRIEREIRELNLSLEWRVSERTAELEAANRELEAFSTSVAHDLRSPLCAVEGYSTMLLEKFSGQHDDASCAQLTRIREAGTRMAELIDDMLRLAHVASDPLELDMVDLALLAGEIAAGLRLQNPLQQVSFSADNLPVACADRRLMKIELENLLGNAWKFTSKTTQAMVRFGAATDEAGLVTYFVSDNGAGFDMKHAGKLFKHFQRLHSYNEFAGTGIGLATVQRIIHRHGGRIWAEGAPGEGAVIRFVLPAAPAGADSWESLVR